MQLRHGDCNCLCCISLHLNSTHTSHTDFGGPLQLRGATPLYFAAQYGHLEVVRRLLDQGCAMDAPDNVS
jgi:ankyrin repeat protein